MADYKVQFGEALPKERWELARDDMKQLAPMLGRLLLEINGDGMGKQDVEDFTNDMLLAVTALNYVSEFATDKCRFIQLRNFKENEK